MSEKDPRPSVWVGHVVLESDRLDETAKFMQTMGGQCARHALVVIAKDKVAAAMRRSI